MLASRSAVGVLLSLLLAPCDGPSSGSDAAVEDGSSAVDAAGAPVVDEVVLPEVATIDVTRGAAHVVGSIAFHSDTSVVTAITVAEGNAGALLRGPVRGPSPQPLVFDLASPGARVLSVTVQDREGRTSVAVQRVIVVRE